MRSNQFATAITCIDGRVQEPVIAFLKKNYGVKYVDTISAPGVDKILSQRIGKWTTALIKKDVRFSVQKHH